MTITYQKETDGLYIQTAIGFWKIIIDKGTGKYVLYHRNFFKEGMSFNQAIQGGFHRQRDMKDTKEIDAMIRYVAEHDKAKVIIMNDYRKLPKATEKQKKYYRQAENRARRQSHRRVDKLFAMIENEHPEYRKQAMM